MPLLLPSSLLFLFCCFSSVLLLLLLMLMMNEGCRQPFTTSQLQELEWQALIFDYMALGIPVPLHLVRPFKRSYASDPFTLFPSMNFGRKADEDPEPWRCKRTDGKKWRCSREASGDSKYCERHRHRGKKCLTKTAEMPLLTSSPSYISSSSSSHTSPSLALRLESPCHLKENEVEKKQDHCFVFGADLKLQKPMNVVNENREAQSPKLQLSFFSDFPDKRDDPWMDSMECATQLSMSISRR